MKIKQVFFYKNEYILVESNAEACRDVFFVGQRAVAMITSSSLSLSFEDSSRVMQQLTKPHHQRTNLRRDVDKETELSENDEVEDEKSQHDSFSIRNEQFQQQDAQSQITSQHNQTQNSVLRRKLRQEFRILIEEIISTILIQYLVII
jgi:preprotein translocase subunit SecF